MLLASPAFAQERVWSPDRDPVLREVGQAIRDRRFADAEKALSDAIPAAEKAGPSPQLGIYLRNLASLRETKDLSAALVLMQRALENDRSLYGSTDIRLALSMRSVASILRQQKRNAEAEDLFRQAVEIVLHAPNPNDVPPAMRAEPLAALASLYGAQGRTGEAIQLFEDASKMCGSSPSPVCGLWNGELSDLYRKQGRTLDVERLPIGPSVVAMPVELAAIERQAQESTRNRLYIQAEVGYRQAIAWIEQHPQARMDSRLPMEWITLGQALEAQARDYAAEEAYKKAIELGQARINPRVPRSALGVPTGPLTILYRRQGRFQEAEAIIRRTLDTQEKVLGPDHAAVADTLAQLAQLDEAAARTLAASDREASLAKYSAAASVYERVLKIAEKNYGPDDKRLAFALSAYAGALLKLGRAAEAAAIQARLDSIRKHQ